MSGNLQGILWLFAYYIISASAIALTGRLLSLPKELIRKSYHIMVSLSIFLLLQLFTTWQMAMLTTTGLFLTAYFVVWGAERLSFLKPLFINRGTKTSEVRKQIIYISITFAFLISLFWGVLGEGWKPYAALGLVAWGCGDAAAAIFGKKFGKKKFSFAWFDKAKTWEGTTAMVIASAVGIFLVLKLMTNLPLVIILISATLLGMGGGIVELVSKKGSDTLTIPISIALLAVPLNLTLIFVWKWFSL